MKVLFISEYFYPKNIGGGEISCFLLAKELAKNKVDVHVLTSYFKGDIEKEVIDGVRIFRRVSTGDDPKYIFDNISRYLSFKKSLLEELACLDSTEDYDLVHCFNTTSVLAAKEKKRMAKRFIMHVNSPLPFCPKGTLMLNDKKECGIRCSILNYTKCYLQSRNLGKMRLTFDKKFNPLLFLGARQKYAEIQGYMKEIDFFTPNSRYMEKRLLMEGIPAKKIKIIPNILNFGDAAVYKKKVNNKVKKILYLGEYSSHKGPQILIDALKLVKESYEATFYGDGELKEMLMRQAKRHNIPAKINSRLPYSDAVEAIKEHDIIVLPSFVAEAFPRVALDACSFGKLVIASDVGGVRDIIEEGENGYLFKPGDSKWLATLVEKALHGNLSFTPEKTASSIQKKFDNRQTVNSLIEIYKSAGRNCSQKF